MSLGGPSEAGSPLPSPSPRTVSVAWDRLAGWIERFEARHPGTTWELSPSRVTADCDDGTKVSFEIPLPGLRDQTIDALTRHLTQPWQLGVVLVRRGGFAVARVVGVETVEAKVGKRHVQGRTKAGGWSQQRFARRRSNQAQAAFDAAGEHVERILLPHASHLQLLGTGGDRRAVHNVLSARSLRPLADVSGRWLGAYGDPRRDVLTAAVVEVRSVLVQIVDPAPSPNR